MRISASPEFRRKQARERAASKRRYEQWLRDPVAQAEHAARCEQWKLRVKQEQLERAKAMPAEYAEKIRQMIQLLRSLRRRHPMKAFQPRDIEALRQLWRYRRAAQHEFRILSKAGGERQSAP